MLTMCSTVERAVRLYGARPAILDDEGTLTWAQFGERVAKAAGVLAGLGVKRGQRFAIIAANSFRQAELVHAGYWMGSVSVPLNYRLAPSEMAFILQDSGCEVVAVEEQFLPLLDDEHLAPWRGRAFAVSAKPLGGSLPDYEKLMGAAAPAPVHPSEEDDDAILLYTGGTTGRPKGVRLSHKNLAVNALQLVVANRTVPDDVYLHVAPMFHAADLLGNALTVAGGAHVYLSKFTGEGTLAAMSKHGVTCTTLPPTMVILTIQEGDFSKHDLSKMRLIAYGSAPMAVEWAQKAMAAWPNADLQHNYGLTETSPILTAVDNELARRAIAEGDTQILRSCGQALPGIDLRVVDDEDRDVPLGEVGEVVVRGPNVTKGYLNRPEENEKAFRNGWFHTGDVGYLNEEGFLFLLDRKKDMVITGSENVYTAEVEAVLYQHPDVHEAAVIGVPDPKYGEALFAVIVPAPGKTLTAEEMIAHCRGKIGGYKIPRQMDFVAEFPKSAMGKILKNELRDRYGKGKPA